MQLILWLLFGALAGWIASLIMGTDESQGAIANILVGIVGAFIGGFVMSLIGGRPVNGFDLYSLLVAIGGAIILLAIVRALRRA